MGIFKNLKIIGLKSLKYLMKFNIYYQITAHHLKRHQNHYKAPLK